MTGLRFWLFLTFVLVIWAAMHGYVFWRAASVPWVANHVPRRYLVATAVALWCAYPVARILEAADWQGIALPLEFASACWIGILFLCLSALVMVEVVTLGGAVLGKFVTTLRGLALIVAWIFAGIGLVQAQRDPVLRDYEVELAGLPASRDGLVLVQISDCHLGTLIGRKWLERLVDRVNLLRPDIIAIVGDLVDGNVGRVQPLQPVLQKLQAPLGVWAVTGNHEYYAGLDRSLKLLEQAGYTVLRDRSAEVVPGLVLCGVDDLTARRQFGENGNPVKNALAERKPGAAILLSHSPWQAAVAAEGGAGLMLCGHTHEGQVWPFKYLVALSYPLIGGRYEVKGMPVIVCRGTGTWGPRLRLWRPSEFVRIKLRSGPAVPGPISGVTAEGPG